MSALKHGQPGKHPKVRAASEVSQWPQFWWRQHLCWSALAIEDDVRSASGERQVFNFDARINHLDLESSLDVEKGLNWESNRFVHKALSTLPACLLQEGRHYFSDSLIHTTQGESDILVKVKPDIRGQTHRKYEHHATRQETGTRRNISQHDMIRWYMMDVSTKGWWKIL